ncbi:MAG: TlpA family protein disulfide reductase [Idiomarina sp.]|nr:TlpA family protein disulfide reductase [Idiomarina sp.]
MLLILIVAFTCLFIAALVYIVRRQQGKAAAQPAIFTAVIGLALAAGLFTFVLQQGTQLPRAELMDMQQNRGELAEYFDGRPMVVNLWASWCPPCVREMPMLEDAENAHPDVRFVFINQREHEDLVAQFLIQHSLSLDTVLLDAAGDFSAAVGAHVMPTTLFFDADANLQKRFYGEVNQATLDEGLGLIRDSK